MQDFEQYLMEKYPSLHRKDGEGNTLPPECGNDCPEGWKDMVDELCQCIHDYVTLTYHTRKKEDGSFEKVYPPTVIIDQIKSKFGGLRFYFSGGDDRVRGMVAVAEHLCSSICENTGEQPARKFVKNGWISTLSDVEINRLTKRLDEIQTTDILSYQP
jgi:hypothetical protein